MSWLAKLKAAIKIRNSGSDVTQRQTLNFTGPGVSVADDPVGLQTTVTIAAGAPNAQVSAKAASTSVLTKSGTQTIDGVGCGVGDVVLQATPGGNASDGLWIVAAGSWSRTGDLILSGLVVFCQNGATWKGQSFVLTTPAPFTVGSDPLRFLPQSPSIDARVLAAADGSTDDLANIQAAFVAAPAVVYSKGSGAYKIASNGTLGTYGAGQFHEFAPGALIHIPTGVTLTVYGDIKAGMAQQCFQVDSGGTLIHVPTSGPISAVWYGAKDDANTTPGSGTDSTIGLQTALNAAGQIPAGTGTVIMPGGGGYRITDTLNMPGGVILKGDGNGGVGAAAVIYYQGANGTNCLEIRATPNTTGGNQVEDLFIGRLSGSGGDAIFIQGWVDGGMVTHRPANILLKNVVSFSPLGGAMSPQFARGLHVDGSALDVAGDRGVRATHIIKCRFGDCSTNNETVYFSQITHVIASYLEIDPGPTNAGSFNVGMTIDKGGATESADVFLYGLECNGNLLLSDACRSVKISGSVAGDLVLASSVSNTDLHLDVYGNVTLDVNASGTLMGTWAGAGLGKTFTDNTDGVTFVVLMAGYLSWSRIGRVFSRKTKTTTTNATAVNIDTIPVPIADSVSIIKTRVVANQVGTPANAAAWVYELPLVNIAGTCNFFGPGGAGDLLQNISVLSAAAIAGSWGAGILPGAAATPPTANNTAAVVVQGQAATTINWVATTTIEVEA